MPRPLIGGDLTGARRFRVDWRNRLILQVEERQPQYVFPKVFLTVWRDAHPRDMATLDYLDRIARGDHPPPPNKFAT